MQGEQVEVEVYQSQNGDWAGNVDLEVSERIHTLLFGFQSLPGIFSSQVGYNNKKTVTNETYDSEELSHVFINVSPSSRTHPSRL